MRIGLEARFRRNGAFVFASESNGSEASRFKGKRPFGTASSVALRSVPVRFAKKSDASCRGAARCSGRRQVGGEDRRDRSFIGEPDRQGDWEHRSEPFSQFWFFGRQGDRV